MKLSVRLWQTSLFVTVIVLAMLILGTFLLGGIQHSIRDLALAEQSKDAAALAHAMTPYFPLTVESLSEIRSEVDSFRGIFGDDVWVFDRGGRVIDRRGEMDVPEDLLEEARLEGIAEPSGYSVVFLETPGVSVASHPMLDAEGRRSGVVIVAEDTSDARAVLDAARRQLVRAAGIALVAAGLVGLLFSDFISRRVHGLQEAASAIADGDFGRRLPTGLVPDEIRDLAHVYNRMAEQLGHAFSSIREREQEIAAVVESMTEGVVALDEGGIIRLANPAAERILRMKADDLVGHPVRQGIIDDDVLAAADRGLAGEQVVETVALGVVTVEVLAAPIGEPPELEGAVLILRDVTERQRWERAQREFIAHASHELRTPISAMKGFLELLDAGAKDDQVVRDDFLGTMHVEVERLARLVDDLFMLAQFDAGRMVFEMESCSLAAMIEDVVAIMRPLVVDAGVTLETDLAPGRLCVRCDRDRIVQVLVGFVDNALKHVGKGDIVSIAAGVEGSRVWVEVRDTGTGIPAEAVSKILERFFRVPGRRGEAGRGERARPGAGLGLAIAKEIVEAHGGSITVSSEPQHGAAFRFDLEAAAGCEC